MLYQSLFKTSHVTRRPSLKRLSAIQVQLLSLCMGKHQNWLYQSRGRPIYRLIFVIFFIYWHRPISVFSSADLKSGTSAGSPVLLVRWTCCCMWRTPSQNFWNIQSWEIKARLKLLYFKFLWPYIYYILLVNYEVLLHSVKEKTNSTEPSGTGIMLQLVEGSLTCS